MGSRHVCAYFSEVFIKSVQQLPNKLEQGVLLISKEVYWLQSFRGKPWERGVKEFGGWKKQYHRNLGGNPKGWGEITKLLKEVVELYFL